ncbi:hypothetical protein D3C76_1796260 [compost metagenome]
MLLAAMAIWIPPLLAEMAMEPAALLALMVLPAVSTWLPGGGASGAGALVASFTSIATLL